MRLGALLALRRGGEQKPIATIERALRDPDERVRIAALMWAADEKALPPARARSIDRALTGRPSPELVRVHAAAATMLKVPLAAKASAPGDGTLLARLKAPPADPAAVAQQREAVWAKRSIPSN